jgi:WhiB family redox-sensing transcriptional regulator
MSTAIPTEALPTTRARETRVTWVDFALCKGKTDIFFGPPGERPSKRRKRETLARSYCNVCPVAEPCRDAGRVGLENGVWGGENEEGRARAGYTPKATERRSVAAAAREARIDQTIENVQQSA